MNNKVDIIIITIYIFFIIYGYVRGLIQSIITFVVLAGVSVLVMSLNFPQDVYIYKNITLSSTMIKIFLFLILTLFGMYIGNIITGKLIKFNIIGAVDKLLGSLFGLVLGTFVVYGLNYIIMFFFTSTVTAKSKIFPYINTIFSKLIHYVK